METTAKVDIRKLQLLNDRIAQTMEALNQVRLSVHGLGLSHTTPGLGFGGGVPFGGGQQFGQQGINPFQALQGMQGMQSPFQQYGQGGFGGMQGLSHTGGYGYPQQIGQQWGQQQSPWGMMGQQHPLLSLIAQNPALAQVLGGQVGQGMGGFGGGLGHTSPEWSQLGQFGQGQIGQGQIGQQFGLGQIGQLDPFTVQRIMQAFPFAQLPISPVQQY